LDYNNNKNNKNKKKQEAKIETAVMTFLEEYRLQKEGRNKKC
jgi:uncharacterized DUF497 family protein